MEVIHKMGDEDFAQSESIEDNPERQLKEENQEINAHAGPQEPTGIKADTSVAKPVLTQRGIMDNISRQPQALMQKMEWEQKRQCYKELLSGYESPNGTTMSVAVDLTVLMFVSAVTESAQMINS